MLTNIIIYDLRRNEVRSGKFRDNDLNLFYKVR